MDKISLDQKLHHIGVQLIAKDFKIKPGQWIDIEQTIYEATFEAPNDPRIFFVLCGWVLVHGECVIIEKLMKIQKKKKSPWLIALAIFATQNKHKSWEKLIEKVDGQHALSSDEMISFKGVDENFKKYGFKIAKGSLRVREKDAMTPEVLLKKNAQYRNRILYGANWRSDIISAIQKGFANPYQIAKAIGCSYPSAHRVFKDYIRVAEYVIS